jgi:ABC-2 type transport system ATP-binding protein
VTINDPVAGPLGRHCLAVVTDELSVAYGGFTAVDRVSLRVAPGSIYGLLGPNGAGKTSVIRALTTIVPIAGGSATIAGHPLSDPVAVRSCIGVLPESNGYPPAQTARSYLRFYGQLFGLGAFEADRRAHRLLQRVGLHHNQARISTFSRGMRQRLGLARALINDPVVLFLDEPTLGLDPAGKEEILAQLADIAVEQGTSVVLCTHLLDEVERICDQVAIMNQGRVAAEGTVDDVVSAAGVAGLARIRVNPNAVPTAERALLATKVVRSVRFDNTRPGDLDVSFDLSDGAAASMLRILLDADVELWAFDLRGARLSDAFLALTTGQADGPGGPEGSQR